MLTPKDKILVIIPVKTNSTRCKNKNIRDLDGKPLYTYAVDASLEFKKMVYCDVVIIGERDRDENTKMSNRYPKLNIFYRPEVLTKDPAQIAEVCSWFLDLKIAEWDTLIMVQPSNPFVTADDIMFCYNLHLMSSRKSIRSVKKVVDNSKTNYYTNLVNIHPVKFKDNIHQGNGSIVVTDIKKFLQTKQFNFAGGLAYNMGGIDVDDEEDFVMAEALIKHRRLN